jgi:hypothetical protein
MPILIYKTLYCQKPPKCTIYIQRVQKEEKGHTSITQPKGNIPRLLSLRPQVSNSTPPVTRHKILEIEGIGDRWLEILDEKEINKFT